MDVENIPYPMTFEACSECGTEMYSVTAYECPECGDISNTEGDYQVHYEVEHEELIDEDDESA